MEKEKKEKKKTRWGYWAFCIIFCLAIGVVVTIVVNSMLGTTTTSGGYPENVKSISLACENTGLAYPIFTYDNSLKKETKINAIFSGEKLKNISLVHSLSYSDLNSSIGSEGHNHAAMNISFGKDDLGADSFSATYSKSEEKMQMTLFATSADFKKETTLKYFFLDSDGEFPKTKTAYEKVLKEKGFSCRTEE